MDNTHKILSVVLSLIMFKGLIKILTLLSVSAIRWCGLATFTFLKHLSHGKPYPQKKKMWSHSLVLFF